MIVDSKYLDELLDEFHTRWPLERIERMTLDEYVSVGDQDTFCQWVETKTRDLGSIKGMNSSKFGIYKRKDPFKLPASFENDEIYSWRKIFGENRNEVFANVKAEVIETIEYAQAGEFHKIDRLELTEFFKWKVAYLYSDERLIPIFTKEALVRIGKHFGLKAAARKPYSEIYKLIISNKPPHLTIHEYADVLYKKFGSEEDSQNTETTSNKGPRKRKATKSLKFGQEYRKGTKGYFASRKHSELQQTLYDRLTIKYPTACVSMEPNYVDVRVEFKDKIFFYEVKSDAHAGDCIRNSLGQLLAYSFHDDATTRIRLFVAGENEANKLDIEFLKFLNNQYDLSIEYIAVPLKKTS
jgi:hypothetical protein